MEIMRSITFEAGHHLPHLPEGHKCRKMHGHTYKVDVWVEGPIVPSLCWVMDFAQLDTALSVIREKLDHQVLNEIEHLEIPTAENLAIWIYGALQTFVMPEGCKFVCIWIHEGAHGVVRFAP